MACNWELFELRVLMFLRGAKVPVTGNFIGETQWQIFNVQLDLKSLGIPDFQGSGPSCNFVSVFKQLAGLKRIRFAFRGEVLRKNGLNFSNIESAFNNKAPIRAAKLFVHRRDWPDSVSVAVSPGILLETVTLEAASRTPHFYVGVSGQSANTINF